MHTCQKHITLDLGKSKTKLARANENRDWRIYQNFVYYLVAEERKICMSEDTTTQFSFSNSVYTFDSMTIDLRFSVVW